MKSMTVAVALMTSSAFAGTLVEAEAFAEKGGWVVDQQFMDQMGSPFLLAHGLGKPVADAVTTVTFPKAGTYRLWVRTRDWCKPDSKVDGPGAFRVVVNGQECPFSGCAVVNGQECPFSGCQGEDALATSQDQCEDALATSQGRPRPCSSKSKCPFGTGGSGAWEWWRGEKVEVKGGGGDNGVEIRLRDLTGFEGRVDALFFGAEGETPPETWAARKKLLGLPEKAPEAGDFEFVVVGGGYAGMCAAVAAARLGVKTAILQDRPVFGGNGSGEVRVGPIGGLDLRPFPKNSDLMHEINELSGSRQATGGVRPKPDDAKVDRWMRSQQNLTCFTSTRGVEVEKNADGTIAAVIGRDIETGRELRFAAKYFCDATGDGWLGLKAGAEVRTEPERQETTGETLAAKANETSGGYGSSNFWMAKWCEKEETFPRCPWAHDVTAESVDVTRPRWPVVTDRPYVAGWNWESGFDKDAVTDGEWIRDNNFRAAYGTWDYYKNKATNRAAYAKTAIEWMGFITGKRAAKRIVGDHVLTEQDLTQHRVYPDGVVTTTWYLDMHFPHPDNVRHFPGHAYRSCAYDDPRWADLGVKNSGRQTWIDPYPIPFRCLYSKTIPNLFMAGKDISATHVAMATVRVENTTGQMGTVVGRAVQVCLRSGWTPRELATKHFDRLAARLEDPRPEVWLFLAGPDKTDAPLVAASVAWMAETCGALCDSYFETYRDGRLFAEHGSQVISGRHFQDLNYLCARANVKYITYGRTTLFDSTLKTLGCEKLGEGSPVLIYTLLAAHRPQLMGAAKGYYKQEGVPASLQPCLYPDIAYDKRLYLPDEATYVSYLDEKQELGTARYRAATNETVATLTEKMAEKWKGSAKSVFFGDPAALACRVPAEVRRRSVPVFAPCKWLGMKEFSFSCYAESFSPLAPYAAQLANELGDRIIYGRQTADGDLFVWAKEGCSIQIVDPYRPTFPCVDRFPQKWMEDSSRQGGDALATSSDRPCTATSADATWSGRPRPDTVVPPGDPSDEQLRTWAKEGKVLTSLIFHSGEIAHTEAMLNVIEFAEVHNFKMGLSVHAQRYETCPQLWELLSVPVNRGGAAELIEPIFHATALGVAPEVDFPPEVFTKNILEAKARIAAIAGAANVPTGYYAFMDSDLDTRTKENPAIWRAAAAAGLDYFVTSCTPGRSKVFAADGITVVNQSVNIVEGGSPYVRLTDPVDLQRAPGGGPGWVVGVLDAPVVAFTPYIWEKGGRFLELVRKLETGACGGRYVNVKPRVIARYAKILSQNGMLK